MTKEEWKDVPGYEGIYKVSNLGVVKVYAKTWESGRWITRSHPEKEMAVFTNHRGYLVLGLRKNGKQRQWAVHQLVALAFIPNPENKPDVNHKDGDKKNNHIENLEWATKKENIQHAHDTGLIKMPKGEKHYGAKLKEADVILIRKSGATNRELAEQFGVSRSLIEGIRAKRTWTHIP